MLYQSSRLHVYREALASLEARGLSFGCACSRQEVGERVYAGTCRNGIINGRRARAVRVRVCPGSVAFRDGLQGLVSQDLEREVGDFVVLRADNIIAYHLAVVVDDAWQGVTEVVRGADLLDSTPRQIYLQQLLGLPQPDYVHLPVALNPDGRKLSKQSGARPIDESRPTATLQQALRFLGHEPGNELRLAGVRELLRWAVENWSLAKVPRITGIPLEEFNLQNA